MTKQEVASKFQFSKKITHEEFEEVLKGLGLIQADAEENAQILCHGAGKRGLDHLYNILNRNGLEIVRTAEDSNNYVASGVLSTNVLANDVSDNSVDAEKAFGYKYQKISEKDGYVTLISAIPQSIGDIALGKIYKGTSKTHNCVLDDLDIHNIPKEFILGVVRGDGVSEVQDFKMNTHFYALNEKNYQNAIESIKKIFANSTYGSKEEYYKSVEARMIYNDRRVAVGLEPIDIPVYQLDAGVRQVILDYAKEQEEKKEKQQEVVEGKQRIEEDDYNIDDGGIGI